MGQVFEFNRKRVFTLEQANDVLPVIRRVTQLAQSEVQQLAGQLNYLKDRERRSQVEDTIFKLYQEWNEKIRKLGCEAKGMWLVDLDNGDGYFCWRFPEALIEYSHGYFGGFRGRVKLH